MGPLVREGGLGSCVGGACHPLGAELAIQNWKLEDSNRLEGWCLEPRRRGKHEGGGAWDPKWGAAPELAMGRAVA